MTLSKISIGSILLKLDAHCVEVFGPSRWHPSRGYHFSFFNAPPEGSTLMEPHLTCDRPGVIARRKRRIWFKFALDAATDLAERFERRLVEHMLGRAEVVTIAKLESEGWDALFIPEPVFEAWLAQKRRAAEMRLSMSDAKELFELGLEHVRALAELDALVDEDPTDRRRRTFSLVRLVDDEIEHDFLHWAEDQNNGRVWFRITKVAFEEGAMRRLLIETFPPPVLEAMATIFRKLGFDTDDRSVADALREARAHHGVAG